MAIGWTEPGFDSDEVRQAIQAEINVRVRLQMETLKLWIISLEAAPCEVCGKWLEAGPFDNEHHAAFHPETHEPAHYCEAHCPACNRKENDGP